jgi:DNA (cytosine-5)-methyltransferase 1
LENVDRLLKSPSSQRGRDFAIILRCFADLGYAVEWRVINAADYGYAQRRRRVYLPAFHKSTGFYKDLMQTSNSNFDTNLHNRLYSNGFYSSIFPIKRDVNIKKLTNMSIDHNTYADIVELSENFSVPFFNSGLMVDWQIITKEVIPDEIAPTPISEIRHFEPVDEKSFINGSLEKMQYLKGAKKIERIRPNGEPYFFSEGAIPFPDCVNKPARTILTSESSVNRSTHVIEDAVTGKLRVLTPVECERLNGFEDNWTNTGMPEKFRYFTMGNALVVPVVERIGQKLLELI